MIPVKLFKEGKAHDRYFWEHVQVAGEKMRLYVSVPEGTGPFPAVVVIQHQGGVDEFYSYPGANHAFMNRHGARYHAEADRDSWPKTLVFFDKYLVQVAV